MRRHGCDHSIACHRKAVAAVQGDAVPQIQTTGAVVPNRDQVSSIPYHSQIAICRLPSAQTLPEASEATEETTRLSCSSAWCLPNCLARSRVFRNQCAVTVCPMRRNPFPKIIALSTGDGSHAIDVAGSSCRRRLEYRRLKSVGLRSSAKAHWGRHRGSTLKSASWSLLIWDWPS